MFYRRRMEERLLSLCFARRVWLEKQRGEQKPQSHFPIRSVAALDQKVSNARKINARIGDGPFLHDGWTTLARLPALRRLLVDVPGSLLSSHSHRHSLPCPCLRCTRQPGSWLGFGSLVLVCRWPEGLRRQGSMWRETVGAAAVDVAVDGGGGAGGFGRWLDGFALAGARVVMVCASSNSPSKTGRCARSGVAAADLACPAGRSDRRGCPATHR